MFFKLHIIRCSDKQKIRKLKENKLYIQNMISRYNLYYDDVFRYYFLALFSAYLSFRMHMFVTKMCSRFLVKTSLYS
jgi:hypothetical protein